jgi:hypothetical protein
VLYGDQSSTSGNYCDATKENPKGILLLCAVALGKTLNLTQAKFVNKLPKGKNSIKGVGKMPPDLAKLLNHKYRYPPNLRV